MTEVLEIMVGKDDSGDPIWKKLDEMSENDLLLLPEVRHYRRVKVKNLEEDLGKHANYRTFDAKQEARPDQG